MVRWRILCPLGRNRACAIEVAVRRQIHARCPGVLCLRFLKLSLRNPRFVTSMLSLVACITARVMTCPIFVVCNCFFTALQFTTTAHGNVTASDGVFRCQAGNADCAEFECRLEKHLYEQCSADFVVLRHPRLAVGCVCVKKVAFTIKHKIYCSHSISIALT